MQSTSVPNGDSALRAWRKAQKMTLVEAARLVSTSHSVWLRWETRERLPRGLSLQRLARATGLSSDKILGLVPHDIRPEIVLPAPILPADAGSHSDPTGVALTEEAAALASSVPFADDRAD